MKQIINTNKIFLIILIIFLYSLPLIKINASDKPIGYYYTLILKEHTFLDSSPYRETPEIKDNYKTIEECNTKRTEYINSYAFTSYLFDEVNKKNGYINPPGECKKGNTNDPVFIYETKGKTLDQIDDQYTLLAPIGNFKTAPDNIGDYFNIIIKTVLGLAAVLAVIMIIIGGIQYMGDESIFGKTEAKSKITKAILGLLIGLGAYALLNTINPDLLGGGGIHIGQVSGDLGDADAPISGNNKLPSSIICSGGKSNIPNISKSFKDKMTYSQEIPKGQLGPNNTIKLDCSGFVNYVLQCAGLSFKNVGTISMFPGTETVISINGTKINGKELQIGDLVGWMKGENKGTKYEDSGHVMIYVGSGILNDSNGSNKNPGKAFGQFNVNKYAPYIKHIIRK